MDSGFQDVQLEEYGGGSIRLSRVKTTGLRPTFHWTDKEYSVSQVYIITSELKVQKVIYKPCMFNGTEALDGMALFTLKTCTTDEHSVVTHQLRQYDNLRWYVSRANI